MSAPAAGGAKGGAKGGDGGEAHFMMAPGHPCLPGHFPGEAIVPGVALLEAVLAAMGVAATQPRALAWVKFLRPLLPAQQALIRWRAVGGQLRFEVLREGEGEGEVLVRGALGKGAP
jgi:3-hydroxymyristoyl/3-hydroxydecanoyl-(acyl carrier protein) dehydratase